MPQTPQNIVRHELIGLFAEIVECKDKKMLGLKGTIINETKNMIVFRAETAERAQNAKIAKIESAEMREKQEKSVQKAACVFRLLLPEGKRVDVNGLLLVGRPEERIKKKFPKKWGQLTV